MYHRRLELRTKDFMHGENATEVGTRLRNNAISISAQHSHSHSPSPIAEAILLVQMQYVVERGGV